MRKKNYTFWLAIVYIAMAALCAGLMIFSNRDIVTLVINIAMFVIVGIIFIFSARKFSIGWQLQKALYSASAKIKNDAKADSRYLWDKYKKEPGGGLFQDNILTKQYQKYVTEMLRLEKYKNADYKCDIHDYINQEYVDASMKKNILNLVAGTMTGLGILGTFIGLSFGLQFFNTGTAAEITESIAPLMDGIKVAFHTSIYGMIFSLVFSFVYKASMEAVYVQLDEFLSLFDTYVVGDTINDNESTMREMLQTLPQSLSTSISDQMTPIVYNMNKTMMEFAQTVAENQAEGIRGMANEFLDRLNQTMGDSYERFGRVINETVEIQKENNEYARAIMDKLAQVSGNVNDINTLSVRVLDSMSCYIAEVEKLQSLITENYDSTYRQMQALQEHEERMQGYVHAISSYEKDVNDGIRQQLEEVVKISDAFSDQVQSTSRKLSEMLDSAGNQINDAAKELSEASKGLDERLTSSVRETFSMFDSNMAHVTEELGDTIDRIEKTTDRVPEVVVAAYDGLKQSFDSMQKNMDELIRALENKGVK